MDTWDKFKWIIMVWFPYKFRHITQNWILSEFFLSFTYIYIYIYFDAKHSVSQVSYMHSNTISKNHVECSLSKALHPSYLRGTVKSVATSSTTVLFSQGLGSCGGLGRILFQVEAKKVGIVNWTNVQMISYLHPTCN